MKCADLSRRLFQVLPTAGARRERPVTSTPSGGSALLIVSLLALRVIATGSNNWYDHTDWAGAQLLPSPTPGLSSPTAPPSSDSLPSPISRTNYQLVWSDEFNGTSIDASKWNKVGPWGHPVASGWSGHFSYNRWNVSEANGSATITVHNTGGGPGGTWTGGVLSTDTTKLFRYGYFEARVKLPAGGGAGLWPAFWLVGKAEVPAKDGEIDIMEFYGQTINSFPQTLHYGTQSNQAQVVNTSSTGDWTQAYHLFQVLWTPSGVTFYVDNVKTASYTAATLGGIPSQPMMMILNFDVGVAWSHTYPNSSTPTTAKLNVAYVRVYQQS